MHKPQFINNEFYHVYNRGVEKRNIFLDDKDHLRFIHDIFEFNDEALSLNDNYFFNKHKKTSGRKSMGVELP